jgi:hypothetical protein
VENPAELHSAHLPADQDYNKPFSASAYHVPPNIYAPKAYAYRNDDHVNRPHLDGPLPQRCQFMFSDGRQCTMTRSDIHPSLCPYHSEREEQLFGEPSAKGLLRGPSFDLPELFTASGDLTTAAGVNRALGQVFRLFAQRRISRQEAATFGHLAKLLLRTISLMAAESLAVAESDDVSAGVILSEQPGSPTRAPQRERMLARQIEVARAGVGERSAQFASRSSCESHGNQELSHVNKVESKDPSAPPPASTNSSMSPIAPSPDAPTQRVAMNNSRRISTSAPPVGNSPEINTSKNIELDPLQNQHLQNRSEGEPCSSGRTAG